MAPFWLSALRSQLSFSPAGAEFNRQRPAGGADLFARWAGGASQETALAEPVAPGAYRYPLEAAARVAVGTTAGFLEQLEEDSLLSVIRFVLFSDEALAAFERARNG